MSNVRLKNGNYIDSKGIKNNNELLSDVLTRVDTLHCKVQYTGNNNYTDFDLKYKNSPTDRRVYFYMAVSNGPKLFAGVFSYVNGEISEHKSITDRTAAVIANDDHTIRIKLNDNWASIILISTFPM